MNTWEQKFLEAMAMLYRTHEEGVEILPGRLLDDIEELLKREGWL